MLLCQNWHTFWELFSGTFDMPIKVVSYEAGPLQELEMMSLK